METKKIEICFPLQQAPNQKCWGQLLEFIAIEADSRPQTLLRLLSSFELIQIIYIN